MSKNEEKFYFSNKRSYLVLLLSEFLLPSTASRRGAGDVPGVLLLCIPWTELSVIPVLGIMELNGCRLRKFYIFFSFLQLCKHVWLNPGVSYTTIPYIYMCIYILYNHSQGQLKSHYFIFQLCKNYNFLVSSWPESAAFSFQAAGDQLDQQMTTCELYAKLSTLLSVGSIPRTQEMVFYCSYKNYHLLA